MMRPPLTELGNQRQPRPRMTQTYGKKKGRLFQSHQAQQSIFGQDENEIEDRLAAMSLKPETCTQSPPVTQPVDQHAAKSSLPPKTEDANKGRAESRSVKSGKGDDQADTNRPRSKVARTEQDHKSLLISDEDTAVVTPLLEQSGKDIELFPILAEKLTAPFDVEKVGEGSFAEVFKLTPFQRVDEKAVATIGGACTARGTRRRRSILDAADVVSNRASIIKVIPLIHPSSTVRSNQENGSERRSTVESVAQEVDLLRNLDPIHGFIRFRGIRLVTGAWPKVFMTAFRSFKKRFRNRALNLTPDTDFGESQIYALIEMDDAGHEIHVLKKPSVFQAWDIFWISVILLANAESQIEFEHRDLHMSNICIKARPEKRKPDPTLALASDTATAAKLPSAISETETKLRVSTRKSKRTNASTTSSTTTTTTTSSLASSSDGIRDIDPEHLASLVDSPEIKLGLSNIRLTIIDYTIARARFDPSSLDKQTPMKQRTEEAADDTEDRNDEEGHVIFTPIRFASNPWHPGEDIESHLQYITYRKSRAIAVQHHHQQLPNQTPTSTQYPEDTSSKWRAYIPKTNTVWLGYLIRVLLHRSRNPRTSKHHIVNPPSSSSSSSLSATTRRKTKILQESMWETLDKASQTLNGNDYRELEEEDIKWLLPEQSHSFVVDDDDDEEKNENENEKEKRLPRWSDEELDCLPGSAGEVLALGLKNGWLGEEEVAGFMKVLEEEDGSN